MPDVEELPILTPIPFTLNIVTLTKPCTQEDHPADSPKPIFPAPPLTPDLLDFRVERKVHLSAYPISASSSEHFVCYVGGLGPDLPDAVYKTVQVEAMEKVWIPCGHGDEKGGQKGQWKQEVTFRSFIRLSCPPSFGTTTMGVSVRLSVLIITCTHTNVLVFCDVRVCGI